MSNIEVAFMLGLLVGCLVIPLVWAALLMGLSFVAEFIAAAREHRRTRLAQIRWEQRQRAEAALFEAEIRADLAGKPFPPEGHISPPHIIPKTTVR